MFFVNRSLPREPRAQRENVLQVAWRGRPYHTLVESFGTPNAILSVPGYRQLKTSIVVYGTRDAESSCIDAFTVVVSGDSGELIISDYFCR